MGSPYGDVFSHQPLGVNLSAPVILPRRSNCLLILEIKSFEISHIKLDQEGTHALISFKTEPVSCQFYI